MQRCLAILSLLTVLVVPRSWAAGTVDLTATELKAGRRLYVAKCARCHKFYDPAKYSETDWGTWMEKMSKKAKLKTEQKELLSRYFETFRSGNTNSSTK